MTWVSILNILKVRSVAGLVLQVSGSLVEVDILDCLSLHDLVLAFSTPAWDWVKDGEGIRPQTDPGNG